MEGIVDHINDSFGTLVKGIEVGTSQPSQPSQQSQQQSQQQQPNSSGGSSGGGSSSSENPLRRIDPAAVDATTNGVRGGIISPSL